VYMCTAYCIYITRVRTDVVAPNGIGFLKPSVKSWLKECVYFIWANLAALHNRFNVVVILTTFGVVKINRLSKFFFSVRCVRMGVKFVECCVYDTSSGICLHH
jgi:hypothetical protein